jgi:hypothetical protein
MTAMSTINLELYPDQLSQPLANVGWRPGAVARSAAQSLVGSLKWIGSAMIWLVVFALPLLLIFLAMALLARWSWKPLQRWRIAQQPPTQPQA